MVYKYLSHSMNNAIWEVDLYGISPYYIFAEAEASFSNISPNKRNSSPKFLNAHKFTAIKQFYR